MDSSFYGQARESKTRQKKKNKAENNTSIKIFAIQMSVALLITGFLYLVCKSDGDLSANVKTLYSAACEKDIGVFEMLDVFKKVSQMTFAPTIPRETSTAETTLAESDATEVISESEKAVVDEAEL